jgi:transcriptional regulator with XRE-family HTH domain
MTRATKKTTAVLAGAVTLASVGFAVGSQAGDGSAVAANQSSQSSSANITIGRGPDGGPGLSALAQRLGVEDAKLRAALEDLRDELPRPERRDLGDLAQRLADEVGISADKVESALQAQRPDRRDRADHHTAIAAALAKELNLEAADVRAALEKVHPRPGARRTRRPLRSMESALAKELGVSTARLREAFRSIKPEVRRGPFAGDLAALAQAMGVETAKLEAAFEKLRAEHEAEHEQRRAAFAKALADKLGLAQGKVEDALEAGGPFGGPGHHGPGGHGGPFGGGPGGP